MIWRDTADRYGAISRLLHWAVAGLILWQLVGMGLKLMLGRVPIASFFVGLHQPLGAVIFVLVVLRLIWAMANRHRRPPHDPGLLGRAAQAGHLTLYALILISPALGLLRAWANTRAFEPFGIAIFPARDTEIGWAVAMADTAHGTLSWAMAVLIAGHIGMVLLHQFIWRDRVLARMAGRIG